MSEKILERSACIPSKLSPEDRIEALRVLNEHLVRPGGSQFSAEQEEEIVNEALRSSRLNYRPV